MTDSGHISLIFTDEDEAEDWLISARWPDGVRCAHCHSLRVNRVDHHKMPYRCLDCRSFFSVTTGTVLHSTNLDHRQLVVAFHLLALTEQAHNLDLLHQDLATTRRAAWFIAHRIREVWTEHAEYN